MVVLGVLLPAYALSPQETICEAERNKHNFEGMLSRLGTESCSPRCAQLLACWVVTLTKKGKTQAKLEKASVSYPCHVASGSSTRAGVAGAYGAQGYCSCGYAVGGQPHTDAFCGENVETYNIKRWSDVENATFPRYRINEILTLSAIICMCKSVLHSSIKCDTRYPATNHLQTHFPIVNSQKGCFVDLPVDAPVQHLRIRRLQASSSSGIERSRALHCMTTRAISFVFLLSRLAVTARYLALI